MEVTHVIDPMMYSSARRQTLLQEAEQERLINLLPRRYSPVRRGVAFVCRWLANWIDDPRSARYARAAEAGPADWATRSAGV